MKLKDYEIGFIEEVYPVDYERSKEYIVRIPETVIKVHINPDICIPSKNYQDYIKRMVIDEISNDVFKRLKFR